MLHAKTEDDFNKYVEQQVKQQRSSKKDLTVKTSNGVRVAIRNKEKNYGIILKNKLSPEQLKVLWVFGAVKKQIRKRLEEMDELPFCKRKYPSQKKNMKLYRSLKPGKEFRAIDMNHAYWRVAFLKGYISPNLYEKLLHKKFKLTRNKALACLTSKDKIEVYRKGKLISSTVEGDPLLAEAYADIRNCTYKVMHDIAREIGNKYFIKYKIDCMYVLKEKENYVTRALQTARVVGQTIKLESKSDEEIYRYTFSHKVQTCLKFDESYFIEDNKENKI